MGGTVKFTTAVWFAGDTQQVTVRAAVTPTRGVPGTSLKDGYDVDLITIKLASGTDIREALDGRRLDEISATAIDQWKRSIPEYRQFKEIIPHD